MKRISYSCSARQCRDESTDIIEKAREIHEATEPPSESTMAPTPDGATTPETTPDGTTAQQTTPDGATAQQTTPDGATAPETTPDGATAQGTTTSPRRIIDPNYREKVLDAHSQERGRLNATNMLHLVKLGKMFMKHDRKGIQNCVPIPCRSLWLNPTKNGV